MNRRQQRKKSKDFQGYLIIGTILVLLLSFAIYYFINKGADIEVDKVSFCPVNINTDTSVVLLDITDKYPEIIRIQIKKYISKIKNKIMKNEKIVIYVIDTNSDLTLRKIISMCNPGDGQGSSYLTENPVKIKKKWDVEFSSVIDGTIDKLNYESDLPYSPIVESLHSLSIDSLLSSKGEDMNIKLYVFSDMIQNTIKYSHYTNSFNYELYKKSKYGNKSTTNLYGADVTLYYIDRENNSIQGKKHVEFWQNWLFNSNSNVVEVTRIH